MAAIPPTPQNSPTVIEVTEANFQQEVLQRSMTTPVLVDFWADWCGPCKALTPILEQLAEEAQGNFVLAKLNTEENPRIAQYFQIQSIPNVKAIFQGQLVNEFTGALPIDKIRDWLKSFLGDEVFPAPKADPIADAKALLEQDDRDGAIALYNTHLQQNPGSPLSTLPLARIALEQGDRTSAKALLEQLAEDLTPAQRADVSSLRFMIDAEPSEHSEDDLRAAITENPLDYQARHDLAMLLATQGNLDGALEELLAIVIRDRTWEDDQARKTMVKLFEVMGLHSPETRAWQKRLGRAMY